MTAPHIKEELSVGVFNDETKNYVATSLQIDDRGNYIHSGIVISLDAEIYYIHYPGNEQDIEIKIGLPTNNTYVLKKLDIFGDDFYVCEAFLAHCQRVKSVSKIQYGFIFDGGIYNYSSGKSESKSGLPDITTCSGFCNKVISGGLIFETQFLKTETWDIINFENQPYWVINNIISVFNNLKETYDLDTLISFCKRIKPFELTVAGFAKLDEIPVSKSFIDTLYTEVNDAISTCISE